MESRTSHKLLVYHSDSKIYEEILSKRLPQLKIHSAAHPKEALGFVEEAEIILAWQIPDEVLKRAKRLKWFSSIGAGNEDLVKNPYLPETVILTKATVYGEMMAEYVFVYLLYFNRHVAKHLKDQRKRVWDRVRPGRLRGKVLGILGLGSVGKEIAKRGKQFGMRVLGLKRVPETVENVDRVFGSDDLKKMIPLVDYLINVLPLTPETYHILGERELSLMKEGSILYSIGRGRTIDEKALEKVLQTKRIQAVLDVFEKEPLPPKSKLWGLKNVIITPHVSGISLPEEISEEFVRNYGRWVKGEPLVGLVDREKGY
jgi:phosphoglycerate dehydrogenase-like enzyme